MEKVKYGIFVTVIMHTINRYIAIPGVVVLIVFVLMAYTSCNKKPDNIITGPCAGVVCYNDGQCIDGKCICIAGYEGDKCEIDSRERYLGSWEVTEIVKGSNVAANINKTKTYIFTIKKSDASKTALRFDNFSGNELYNNIIVYAGRKYNADAKDYYIDITTNFCFAVGQYISGSSTIVGGGNGSVNNLSNYMSGIYYLQYPDVGKTVVDTISFSADHL